MTFSSLLRPFALALPLVSLLPLASPAPRLRPPGPPPVESSELQQELSEVMGGGLLAAGGELARLYVDLDAPEVSDPLSLCAVRLGAAAAMLADAVSVVDASQPLRPEGEEHQWHQVAVGLDLASAALGDQNLADAALALSSVSTQLMDVRSTLPQSSSPDVLAASVLEDLRRAAVDFQMAGQGLALLDSLRAGDTSAAVRMASVLQGHFLPAEEKAILLGEMLAETDPLVRGALHLDDPDHVAALHD